MTALLAVQRRVGLQRGGRRGEFVRSFGVAALSALVCAVMNVLEVAVGGVVAAAVGNATNVFAPAMIWAGARRLNERRDIGAVTAGACALLMLAVTFVLTLDDATLVKTAGIAVFCVLAAVELRRPTLRSTAGALAIAIALFAFAVYNAGRIVIALTAGSGSWAWNTLASPQVTSVASAVVILVMSAAAVPLGRALRADPEPGTREFEFRHLREKALALLSDRAPLVGLTIRVPDLDLIRTAHGALRADDVVATARQAAVEAFPDAAVGLLQRDAVAVVIPADTERAGIERMIHERFDHLMRSAGSTDVPDVRILHRGIADRDRLEEFLGAGRPARIRDGRRRGSGVSR